MDTTIRNIDEVAYRELKARAALTGRTVGDLVNAAIRSYLAARPGAAPKRGSLRDLAPEAYPKGNERLSEQIDTGPTRAPRSLGRRPHGEGSAPGQTS